MSSALDGFATRRLWSLWDMIEIEIGKLVYSLERVTVERNNFERFQRELTKANDAKTVLRLKIFRNLKADVSEIERITSIAGMTSTQQAAERSKIFLSQHDHIDDAENNIEMGPDQCGNVFRHLSDIVSRARDDCISRKYYQIDPQHAVYLDDSKPPFGLDVEAAFSTAVSDISEAAKCYALNRTTATVYHLMRAAETAVKAAAVKLVATVIDKNGNGLSWGPMAQNIKSKIDVLPTGPTKEEWYRVHTEMESMNRGWRTPSMHPKNMYNDEEAKTAFDATKAFMRHLAVFL
jgi:hypothetical protein